MDFLKIRKLIRASKPKALNDSVNEVVPHHWDQLNNEVESRNGKAVFVDASEMDDEEFIAKEVKRRLKELRRNSFMVLIPEESGAEYEEDEEGETVSSEGREMGAQTEHLYCDFESIYEKYCERMLFFDRMSAQQLNEAGPSTPTTPSPRTPKTPSRTFTSSIRRLSLKNIGEPNGETEQLHPPDDTPYRDLETAYVGHMSLTWEALHGQYTQLSNRVSSQPENLTCYNHCAQQYQQFQVLLQRFIENEPFEEGVRVEKYARSRNSLCKLLQVPNVKGTHLNAGDMDYRILAPDMMKLIQTAILTFYAFVRVDKKKPGGVRNLFRVQSQMATPLQQVQSVVEKKRLKLKEICKKKGLKKKTWPGTHEEVELLFSVIDIKVVSRVLKMDNITKEQLLWCEDKSRKLHLYDGKLQRDPSPILFPC